VSVLLMQEIGVLEETTDLSQVTDKLYSLSHNVVSSTHSDEWIRTHNFSGDRH